MTIGSDRWIVPCDVCGRIFRRFHFYADTRCGDCHPPLQPQPLQPQPAGKDTA